MPVFTVQSAVFASHRSGGRFGSEATQAGSAQVPQPPAPMPALAGVSITRQGATPRWFEREVRQAVGQIPTRILAPLEEKGLRLVLAPTVATGLRRTYPDYYRRFREQRPVQVMMAEMRMNTESPEFTAEDARTIAAHYLFQNHQGRGKQLLGRVVAAFQGHPMTVFLSPHVKKDGTVPLTTHEVCHAYEVSMQLTNNPALQAAYQADRTALHQRWNTLPEKDRRFLHRYFLGPEVPKREGFQEAITDCLAWQCPGKGVYGNPAVFREDSYPHNADFMSQMFPSLFAAVGRVLAGDAPSGTAMPLNQVLMGRMMLGTGGNYTMRDLPLPAPADHRALPGRNRPPLRFGTWQNFNLDDEGGRRIPGDKRPYIRRMMVQPVSNIPPVNDPLPEGFVTQVRDTLGRLPKPMLRRLAEEKTNFVLGPDLYSAALGAFPHLAKVYQETTREEWDDLNMAQLMGEALSADDETRQRARILFDNPAIVENLEEVALFQPDPHVGITMLMSPAANPDLQAGKLTTGLAAAVVQLDRLYKRPKVREAYAEDKAILNTRMPLMLPEERTAVRTALGRLGIKGRAPAFFQNVAAECLAWLCPAGGTIGSPHLGDPRIAPNPDLMHDFFPRLTRHLKRRYMDAD